MGTHCAAIRRLSTDRRPLEAYQSVQWLDVRYEDLVGDLEGHAHRLIDYVGLEWDAACLEFHATKRVVEPKPVASSTAHLFAVGRPLEKLPAEPSTFVQAFQRIGSR